MSTNPALQAAARKRKGYSSASSSSSSRSKVARRVPKVYSRNHAISWPRSFGDQPSRKYAKLKYSCMAYSDGIGAAAIKAFEYRANGMYDPEVAVGGHQPYGFDQLMAQYFHFTVLRSTCTAEVQSCTTNSDQIWMLATYNASGTLASAFASGGSNAIHELPIVSKTLILTSGEYRGPRRSTYTSFNASATFGKTNSNLIGDARFQGSDSADPTEDAYFGLVGYDPSGSANASDVYFKVTIVYYGVFTEPRFFTTS